MTTDTGLSTLLAVYARKSQAAEDAWTYYIELCSRLDIPQETINAAGNIAEAMDVDARRAYDAAQAVYRQVLVADGPVS